jgi:GT2 family glycosyltransferase
MVAAELAEHPDAALIYSDEDKIDESGRRHGPYFKPDWNPDLFLAQNLVTHLCVCRTDLVRELGGLRLGYEGAQDWDLAMRLAERVPPERIRHIPHVLYHWRGVAGSAALAASEKTYVCEAQRKVLTSHFERVGQHVRIEPVAEAYWRIRYPLPDDPPLVSLIIPTRDRYDLLRRCVDSIYRRSTYPSFEIVLLDNQTTDPRALRYLEELGARPNVRVVRYDAPFNYSAINNFAVRHARGTVLALINNDVEVITRDWLEEMVSQALRPDIGAVGAMLYYPNDTIQHAGVILGLGGVAGHAYCYRPRGYSGQASRAFLAQNLSAVTAACMVLRREVFDEVGGLDETHLPIAYNDVDLCLRIREKGYRVLWTPYAELYHHESASRGSDSAPTERARSRRELDYMQQPWGDLLQNHPAYNPNLALDRESFALNFPPRAHKPWFCAADAA